MKSVKTTKQFLIILCFCLCTGSTLYGQSSSLTGEILNPSHQHHEINKGQAPFSLGTPVFVEVYERIGWVKHQNALSYLATYLNNETLEWEEVSVKEEQGFKHIKYRQVYRGIPILGSEIIVHYKRDKLYLINGSYHQINQIDNVVKRSIKEVKDKIYKQYDIPIDNLKETHHHHSHSNQQDTQVLFPKANEAGQIDFLLSYQFTIESETPLFSYQIIADAENGEELFRISNIHSGDVTGTGNTMYRGNQSFTTDSVNSTLYRLRNTIGGGILTVDMNNNGVDFTDMDNLWTSTANQDHAALDVHWGVEQTYAYFLQTHNQNSFNGNGAQIKSRVHYGTNYVNAFWDGTQLTFGDGTGNFSPLVSLDIVAHEFTHGLVQYSAGLIYAYESGALNESFADIFGYCVEYFADSNTANFYMGDQVVQGSNGFRNMANPNMFYHPDTYLGTHWYTGSGDNGGVHYNSGVQNYWFYLLCQGGTGTNDIGNTFVVSGLGVDKAAKIAFRNLTTYLNSGSNYMAARNGSIQAAKDLYGTCSYEVEQVTNAWYAVGLGEAYLEGNPLADFDVNQTYFCQTPALAEFINLSSNADSVLWLFGDGQTSSSGSPTHLYTDTGMYDVTLIVYSTCGGTMVSDSITKVDVLEVSDISQAPNCYPQYSESNGYTIQVVLLDTFFHLDLTSSSTNVSYGCQNLFELKTGEPINGHVGSLYYGDEEDTTHHVALWVDYNNDGMFQVDENVFIAQNGGHYYRQDVIFSHPNAVYNTPINLRVVNQEEEINVFNVCATDSLLGQGKDFKVRLIPPENHVPDAAFTTHQKYKSIMDNGLEVLSYNPTNSIKPGDSIQFLDRSLYVPTSYQWYFEGGTPSVSTEKNPTVTYENEGIFDVKLIVSNAFGIDSIIKLDSISVTPQFTICEEASTDLAFGTLFDSGEEDHMYDLNETCDFLINPECSEELVIDILWVQLTVYGHRLKIYDGIDNTGQLLLNLGNSITPTQVTANSGQAYVEFVSNNINSNSDFPDGWKLRWKASIDTLENVTLDIDSFGQVQTPISFQANNLEFMDNWTWSFGDGTFSNDLNPTKTFSNTGDFIIELIYEDCSGIDTLSELIHVDGYPEIGTETSTLNTIFSCQGGEDTSGIMIYNTGYNDLTLMANSVYLTNGVLSDTISPGDSLFVNIFNSHQGGVPYVYNDSIIIHSNDPYLPIKNIYIVTEITGFAQVEIDSTTMNFGIIDPTLIGLDSIQISNTGCDTLFVNTIQFTSSYFNFNSSIEYILPEESDYISVVFTPNVSVVNYSEIMTVQTSVGDYSIHLFAQITSNTITELYVDQSVILSGTGYSWDTPFKKLGDAIKYAHEHPDIEIIHITEGNYKPIYYPFNMNANQEGTQITAYNQRLKTFHLRPGLKLLGGYPNGGGERNPDNYLTILDGELSSTLNASHVVLIDKSSYWDKPNVKTVVDGCIIQNGDGHYSYVYVNGTVVYSYYGGGVIVQNATAQFNQCQIIQNKTKYSGGAVYAVNSNVLLENSTIDSNYARFYGGAIYSTESNITTLETSVNGNKTDYYAGAAYMHNSNLIMDNSSINGNYATYYGGGVYMYKSTLNFQNGEMNNNTCLYYGGGIYVQSASWNQTFTEPNIYINASEISGNSASYRGGGLQIGYYNYTQIENSIIHSNTSTWSYSDGGGIYVSFGRLNLIQNIIYNNSSKRYGGGIYSYRAHVLINQNTIARNTANLGGAIYLYNYIYSSSWYSTQPTILKNTIFWDNGKQLSSGQIQSNDIYTVGYNKPMHFASGSVNNAFQNPQTQYAIYQNLDGMFELNPLFKDIDNLDGVDNLLFTLDDGLTLTSTSPCLDEGTDTSALLNDILGNPRTISSFTDLGAYEHPQFPLVKSSEELEEELTVRLNEGVILYPNPNRGNFNIQYTGLEDVFIHIYSQLGHSVYTAVMQEGEHFVELDNRWADGIYYVHITLKDKTIIKEKVCVIRD